MAKSKTVQTVVEQNLPEPEIKGEGTAAAPPTRKDQIESLQKNIRTKRAQRDALTVECNNIEATLSRLLAEASIERKREKFLENLNPHEAEVLKNMKPA